MKPAWVHFCTHSDNSSVSLSSRFVSVLNSVSGKKEWNYKYICEYMFVFPLMLFACIYLITCEFYRRSIDGLVGHMWWQLMGNTCCMTPLNFLSLTQCDIIRLLNSCKLSTLIIRISGVNSQSKGLNKSHYNKQFF